MVQHATVYGTSCQTRYQNISNDTRIAVLYEDVCVYQPSNGSIDEYFIS